MPAIIKIKRTLTDDLAPTGLADGELAVELASEAPKLWVGCPTSVDSQGRRLLNPYLKYPVWGQAGLYWGGTDLQDVTDRIFALEQVLVERAAPNMVRFTGPNDFGQAVSAAAWVESTSWGVAFTGRRSPARLIAARFAWYNNGPAPAYLAMGVAYGPYGIPPYGTAPWGEDVPLGWAGVMAMPTQMWHYTTLTLLDERPPSTLGYYYIVVRGDPGAGATFSISGGGTQMTVIELTG